MTIITDYNSLLEKKRQLVRIRPVNGKIEYQKLGLIGKKIVEEGDKMYQVGSLYTRVPTEIPTRTKRREIQGNNCRVVKILI